MIWFKLQQGQSVFPLAYEPEVALGPTRLSIHWVLGGRFPGGKAWPVCDADHSLPSSAENKSK